MGYMDGTVDHSCPRIFTSADLISGREEGYSKDSVHKVVNNLKAELHSLKESEVDKNAAIGAYYDTLHEFVDEGRITKEEAQEKFVRFKEQRLKELQS